ncbi:dihydroorotate dehydrogenase electron transfer subunit [Lutispora thermophila]|uniref:Dihydroorotate dehydrogenase electron transfer subunit n=1 Tax=Lutispora thermophila DSM 19022 TaxID=1122184 RepID=A0A1M6DPN9_9FIRM|nr:dihydroorotate dehydrogenase electron transfer subunit [Lutispora thermophila]SHI74958.1 dihydroorotate dehydrogenase electron transfer subunit [Lutispora thermophila DSM 19022]
MKKELFEIISNDIAAENIFKMELSGDTSAITAPGQFINIELQGYFLRRPFSVCDWEDYKLTIYYKVVGKGTAEMSCMKPCESLDVLIGLGNGYNLAASGDRPLLIGGGAGIPPLFGLAKRLIEERKQPEVILGFNTYMEMFLVEEFQNLGIKTTITTADGSHGTKGFVTDAMADKNYSYIYTCGPEAMLKAVYEKSISSGEFSFEERMGCGFGACMGCTCRTKYGNKRICKDGPVLRKEEIIW